LPNERGGTWLGVKRDGRVGILLSMLEKNSLIIPGAPTRVQQKDGRKAYRLVNFINRQNGATPETLGSGIYGFGNSRRQTPFKKVRHGTRLLEEKIKQLNGRPKNELIEEFIRILRDDTWSHTVVLIDGLGHVNYLERSQIPPSKDFENISWVDSVYEFDILD
uniref:DUF5681 domain-containing protein n=1 Tax=Toxocara canis TaxID=6265 RepID=A0A183TX46_TOXCA